jgi:hypothetical protein
MPDSDVLQMPGFGHGTGSGSGAGGGGDTYVVSGTTGHLRASARSVTWRYYDPATAPKHDSMLPLTTAIYRPHLTRQLNKLAAACVCAE